MAGTEAGDRIQKAPINIRTTHFRNILKKGMVPAEKRWTLRLQGQILISTNPAIEEEDLQKCFQLPLNEV